MHADIVLSKSRYGCCCAAVDALAICLRISISVTDASQHTEIALVDMVSEFGVALKVADRASFHAAFGVILFETAVVADRLTQSGEIISVLS